MRLAQALWRVRLALAQPAWQSKLAGCGRGGGGAPGIWRRRRHPPVKRIRRPVERPGRQRGRRRSAPADGAATAKYRRRPAPHPGWAATARRIGPPARPSARRSLARPLERRRIVKGSAGQRLGLLPWRRVRGLSASGCATGAGVSAGATAGALRGAAMGSRPPAGAGQAGLGGIGQHPGNPPQLPHGDTDRDNDEAANRGGGAGADEGISEAELVDRNTKSNHHEARDKGEYTNAKQQRPACPSNPPQISPFGPATFAVFCRLNSSGNGEFSLFRARAATAKVTLADRTMSAHRTDVCRNGMQPSLPLPRAAPPPN